MTTTPAWARRVSKGMLTANLRALQFCSKPNVLSGYLHGLDSVYSSYCVDPLQPVDLAEILAEESTNELFAPIRYSRPGATPFADLIALAALTRHKQPANIFEIGTFEGLTSVVFCKNGGSSVRVRTLDLPHQNKDLQRTKRSYDSHSIDRQYDSGRLIEEFGLADRVERLFGDSALFDFGPYHNTVDLFFVDGAHTEDYVAKDSLNAFRCVTADGWTIWHDCLTPQVLRVLKMIARELPVYQINETNVAIAMQKPGKDFPWHLLQRDIR